MATFVLVHGAWYGSWCWKRVRDALEAAGHDVFTPTLTGVGERSHLRSREVNLETHIQDVLNLIKWEELTDICRRRWPSASSKAQRTSATVGRCLPFPPRFSTSMPRTASGWIGKPRCTRLPPWRSTCV